MVPLSSIRISRVPIYSSLPYILDFNVQDCHLLWSNFPDSSNNVVCTVADWALPLSLAATYRISVDFFSCGYLDVSVPHVRFIHDFSCTMTFRPGFPIRISVDQSSFVSSPQLFADLYVLHRLLPPRHPPLALNILTI